MLEKRWNPRLPADTLRNDLINIHPTASRLTIILDKVKNHAKKVPDFKVGDLALVSTFNFNNVKGLKKLKYSYVGPFFIVSLHGTNAGQVELSGAFENKHPTFPIGFIKPYQPADKELFPLTNPTPLTVPPVEQSEDKRLKKGELGVKIKENIL
ncbi:hypothetical protein O181_059952 [Austropuccinia psidii MF-1]|uniref:Uncharacterized protein n=1 Tax=Austropuccinia psidii MF-1 TaxID=1389203 RepID=A0A9Q3EHP2_9BASI|nr:hypothetical protein [Austropuccinia psidii MF-1]